MQTHNCTKAHNSQDGQDDVQEQVERAADRQEHAQRRDCMQHKWQVMLAGAPGRCRRAAQQQAAKPATQETSKLTEDCQDDLEDLQAQHYNQSVCQGAHVCV